MYMKQTELIKKLLPGFIPLIVFIIADEIWGTKVGLIVAVLTGIAELIYSWGKEKKLDKFVILDTLLLVALSGVSILLENDIFFKLKPGLIELILCTILGVSAFTRIDIVGGMTKRFMKGVSINDEQQHKMRKSLRNMFWVVIAHTILVFYSAFYMSKEAWVFISGGLFYIVFGIYFLIEFIKNRYIKKRAVTVQDDEEWLPVVDEGGKIIGKAPRSVCHGTEKLLHPVVHLHVFNPKGYLFLQKRSMNKEIQPGKWDTAVGGHISFGEEIGTALKREAFEEIGLKDFNAKHLFHYIWNSDVEKEMVYSFVTYDYKGIKIHSYEVEDGKFWSPSQIKRDIGKGIFTPNFEHEYGLLTKVIKSGK